ncbi:hypothetical protein BU14_0161s0011 [Porphyra umbilicalis]|uniref:Uncharacterized protein n=1 Tax=Porphyra umbilicalis TaxID=2786 RepID=A0A1X6P882_PORUM|nr:hypothetical protein BU14_0161s0011 [Porphyra umbilicalis]|eukprot:OSX77089.1 hypothetical protein BU14_0161s0011 [Porphyra umbilicalis]
MAATRRRRRTAIAAAPFSMANETGADSEQCVEQLPPSSKELWTFGRRIDRGGGCSSGCTVERGTTTTQGSSCLPLLRCQTSAHGPHSKEATHRREQPRRGRQSPRKLAVTEEHEPGGTPAAAGGGEDKDEPAR